MAETKSNINKVVKPKSNLPVVPLLILALVIAITAGLFIYNLTTEKEIETLNRQISKVQANIEELKESPEVQVASLIEMNKWSLATLEQRSQITKYINHLESIWKPFIKFEWFTIRDGVISTKAVAQSRSGGLTYETVRNFIAKYRVEDPKDTLFDLNFINGFDGNDTIKFDAEFELKDQEIEVDVEDISNKETQANNTTNNTKNESK